MASNTGGPVAAAVDDSQPGFSAFNLQVVSPSVGVSAPLSFPQLATATTVKQLKEKIREVLPSRPADENQRLIHRGRLLARDAETMSDIFGSETVRKSYRHFIRAVY
jgi:hypothetical protein